MRSAVRWVAVAIGLACAGCATARQSAADLNAGLAWFVGVEQFHGWPRATDAAVALDREPTVLIGWAPPPPRPGQTAPVVTRAARERWIAAVRDKLEHSGLVGRTSGIAPDTFVDGVTIDGLRSVVADHQADLIVLFGFEVTTRRYHAFEPAIRATPPADVASVVEVTALAQTVGLSAAGLPVFTDTQKGFASAEIQTRSVEELESTAKRVAVDALGDAIVRRLRAVASTEGSS